MPSAGGVLDAAVPARLVRLLGPVDVVDGAGAVRAPGSPIRATLLALLALDAGRVVDADHLLDRAWDGRPPASGLRALRFHISRLRAEVRVADLVVTAGHGYRVDADTDVDLVRRGLSDAADVTPLLGLWRGPPLADCAHVTAIENEQQRLDELRLTVTERHFQECLDAGDTTIVADLTGLCLQHPARESLWAILVAAHYHAGDQAQALRSYDQLCRHLRDVLGVSPTPQLQELHHRILDQDLPWPVSASTTGVTVVPGHLPVTASELIGRQSDLRRLGGHLDRHRLVTVLGAGGVGKTRFALEAARERRTTYPDGAWFCDMSSIDAADSVPFVVAQALGLNEHQGRTMTDGLLAWIGDKQILLVLDNCEQVAPAVRDLVGELLATAAGVRVLATSREPLRHEVEQRFPLGPLDPDTDAGDLFRRRAFLSNPALERDTHDAAIIEICRLVDGIPLAVELAAARTAALTPEAIAVMLGDRHDLLADEMGPRPDRQRTLGATIEWSTSSLVDEQRRTLSSLAVFSGGFDLHAAEAVCARTGTTADLVDTLTALVERSLVEMTLHETSARYRILEPIRQHVLRELPNAERHELGGRHARWYARRAQELQEALTSPDEPAAMEETTAELANFRQAHRWAVEHEPPTAGRLISGLVHYEISRLHTEITEWFDQTLAVLDPDDPWYHPTLAGATLGWMLQSRNDDVRRACAAIDETRISPFLRDSASMAAANQARWSGDLGPMERLAERALADGDLFMAVLALGNVGRVDEAISVATRSGIPSAIAYANMHAARRAAQESRDVEAERFLTCAIAQARSVSSWMPLSRSLAQWVKVAERLGLDGDDIDRARSECLGMYERSGLSEVLWAAMVKRDSPETPGVGLA